ncbi:MAG: type II toxin-antitoxin system VapC family toxin [Planctomycetes bacterium]|nr:type II toxin-antitoxin system VapC family toxin [Planctomycetota bacterium]
MRLCVVDCSFAMAWVFEDERNALAESLLDQLDAEHSFVVPAVLWGLEVRNTLRSAVRRQRLTTADADGRRRALAELPKLAVTCPNGLGDVIDELVRNHDLTSYDAAYLAVAIEHDLPLATADAALARAAKTAGVALYGAAT